MPRRAQYLRDDSSETSSTVSESDIPWFGNFGKFVHNPGFMFSGNGMSSPQPLTTGNYDEYDDYEEITESRECSLESRNFQYSSTASANHRLLAMSFQRDVSMRRASSDLNHSRNFRIPASVGPVRTGGRFGRPTESDEDAPKTLGAMLRRMVSFDQYSKGSANNGKLKQGTILRIDRRSREKTSRIASLDDHGCPQSTFIEREQSRAHGQYTEPESLLAISRETMDSSRNVGVSGSATIRGNEVQLKGRMSESVQGDAPKLHGAMLRPMVSFDQFQVRNVRTLDLSKQKGRRVRHWVPKQRESGMSRELDIGSQVRSMQRW